MLSFSKYSGCGNDFILIDHRQPVLKSPAEVAKNLCHRQLGIGADGLILLEDSSIADYKMRIFNSDGSEAEMCGNGIRCLAAFIKKLGISKKSFVIETMKRNLNISFVNDLITVDMGIPTDVRWHINLEDHLFHHLDTGVPHAVAFVEDLETIAVNAIGPKIRHHPVFSPAGANVNFAKVEKDYVTIRTYERGVEEETLACGTGVTATALIAHQLYNLPSPITLKVKSGEVLFVSFTKKESDFTNVCLTGPAKHIFDGMITY